MNKTILILVHFKHTIDMKGTPDGVVCTGKKKICIVLVTLLRIWSCAKIV